MSKTQEPSVARYLVSASRPISLTQSLPLAEKVHQALVEHSNGSSIFTGCDSQRRPLKGHAHAYIFCESNRCLGKGDDGEITHITVYSSNGFGPEDRAALQKLTRVYGGDIPDVSLFLLAIGEAEALGGADVGLGQCPMLASSRRWVSRLPFIPSRHPKVTRAGKAKCDDTGLQIDSPEHELRRLLKLANLPEPLSVEMVAGTALGKGEACERDRPGLAYWNRFARSRSGPGSKEEGRLRAKGYGFRIQFPQPVQGPLALGYASHFGLGSFVPEEEAGQSAEWIKLSGQLSHQARSDYKRPLILENGDLQISLLQAEIEFIKPAQISLWSGRGFMADLGRKLMERVCAEYYPGRLEAKKEEQKELNIEICKELQKRGHSEEENEEKNGEENGEERNQHQPQQEDDLMHQETHHEMLQKETKRPRIQCKRGCQLSHCCTYGHLFLTDSNSPLPPNQQTLPLILSPPVAGSYSLEDEGSGRACIGLCLTGQQARQCLPSIILALKDLEAQGLGKGRLNGDGRFALQSAESITPLGRTKVYEDGCLQKEIAYFSFHEIVRLAHEAEGSAVLQFLTPTFLGDFRAYSSRPAFCRLLYHLLERANQLSAFYGTGLLFSPEKCQDLIREAEEIRLLSAHVQEIYPRCQLGSNADSDMNEASCSSPYFTGEIIYSGSFSREIMALLILGEIIHVGKEATAGNGMFRIQMRS